MVACSLAIKTDVGGHFVPQDVSSRASEAKADWTQLRMCVRTKIFVSRLAFRRPEKEEVRLRL